MKTLQKLCAAAILTAILTVSALADGQMDCGITSAQPNTATTSDGQMDCGFAQSILLTLETVFLLA